MICYIYAYNDEGEILQTWYMDKRKLMSIETMHKPENTQLYVYTTEAHQIKTDDALFCEELDKRGVHRGLHGLYLQRVKGMPEEYQAAMAPLRESDRAKCNDELAYLDLFEEAHHNPRNFAIVEGLLFKKAEPQPKPKPNGLFKVPERRT